MHSNGHMPEIPNTTIMMNWVVIAPILYRNVYMQGGGKMNYTERYGWFYINANNKSPSWTGVEHLYKFLLTNNGIGPQGEEVKINSLLIGDIIQICFGGNSYSHTVVVVKNGTTPENTLIAAHTYDTFGKKLSEYEYEKYRAIHIL